MGFKMGHNKATDDGPGVTATTSGTEHLVPPSVPINENSAVSIYSEIIITE
jgi:hypothetical protein